METFRLSLEELKNSTAEIRNFLALESNEECSSYKVFTAADRQVSYNSSIDFCDKNGWINSDWQGPAWYRFTKDAGSKMPETPPEFGRCGANAPGWVRGGHPIEKGQ